MLTTTAAKSMVMLLLAALVSVNAEYSQDILPTCKTTYISDTAIDYCCPCASTFFGSCVTTWEGTCSEYRLKPGSAQCGKGQWGCYQERRSPGGTVEALQKVEQAVDFLAQKLISLGIRPGQ